MYSLRICLLTTFIAGMVHSILCSELKNEEIAYCAAGESKTVPLSSSVTIIMMDAWGASSEGKKTALSHECKISINPTKPATTDSAIQLLLDPLLEGFNDLKVALEAWQRLGIKLNISDVPLKDPTPKVFTMESYATIQLIAEIPDASVLPWSGKFPDAEWALKLRVSILRHGSCNHWISWKSRCFAVRALGADWKRLAAVVKANCGLGLAQFDSAGSIEMFSNDDAVRSSIKSGSIDLSQPVLLGMRACPARETGAERQVFAYCACAIGTAEAPCHWRPFINASNDFIIWNSTLSGDCLTLQVQPPKGTHQGHRGQLSVVRCQDLQPYQSGLWALQKVPKIFTDKEISNCECSDNDIDAVCQRLNESITTAEITESSFVFLLKLFGIIIGVWFLYFVVFKIIYIIISRLRNFVGENQRNHV